MNLVLFVLRSVVGVSFMGHGAQKLWGAFGGHGIEGTGQFFESLGLRPGRLNAQAAGFAEFFGGMLLVLGLVTPLAAVMIVAVMTVAVITVHAKNGPWVTEQGYEYNVVLAAAALVAAAAPGTWSLDNAMTLDIHGAGAAIIALVVGVWGGALAVFVGRSGRLAGAAPEPAPTPDPAQPEPESADDQRFARHREETTRAALRSEDAIVERAPRDD